MEPFTDLTAVALPLMRPNVDTDAIIPSREMKRVSKKGLAQGLFAGWRYLAAGSYDSNPDFILNDPAYAHARILLSGGNFGCGSSREHAVWALREYGFKAIIAPSFGSIFQNNCLRNGVLPVVLNAAAVHDLARQVAENPQANRIAISLEQQSVTAPDGRQYAFDIAPQYKEMLQGGLDFIDVTLKHRKMIETFRQQDKARRPWAYLQG